MCRLLLLASLVTVSVPALAQTAIETDSDYLQHRAASLNDRIDIAVRHHNLSRRKASDLHLAVRRVQTSAGNLQTRNGLISRPDADRMNQRLTDVERTLTHQP